MQTKKDKDEHVLLEMTINMLQIKQDQSIQISDVILIIQGIKDIFISTDRKVMISGKPIKLNSEHNFAKFSEKLRPWTDRTLLGQMVHANMVKQIK